MWNIPYKQYCLLIGPDLPCCTGQSDIRHAGSNRCASAPRHMRFLSLLAWYLMVTWLALAGVILQVAPTRSGRFCVVKQSNWRCQTMHNFGSKTAWIISVSEEDRKFCWMFILAKDLWDSLSLASHFISEKVSLLSNRTLPCWRLCLWCVQSPVAGQNTSPSPEQILVLDIALLPSKQFFWGNLIATGPKGHACTRTRPGHALSESWIACVASHQWPFRLLLAPSDKIHGAVFREMVWGRVHMCISDPSHNQMAPACTQHATGTLTIYCN
jgi:hypothetical protein